MQLSQALRRHNYVHPDTRIDFSYGKRHFTLTRSKFRHAVRLLWLNQDSCELQIVTDGDSRYHDRWSSTSDGEQVFVESSQETVTVAEAVNNLIAMVLRDGLDCS
jgi:hypothetical protein